jgi:hypothetical protein
MKLKAARIEKYINQRHQWPKDFDILDVNEYIEDIDDIRYLEPRVNSPLKKSEIKKGIAEGIKFDSQYEYAWYLWAKYIKGWPVIRNKTEFLYYENSQGKRRKWFPDFIRSGIYYVEIKGFERPDDHCKREQHSEVEYYGNIEMTQIIAEVNKRFPNWRKDYIKL